MKIHYFQRYHDKENVTTANTMLLLSRLYQYSSDKFFRFLKDNYFSGAFEPEIEFELQARSSSSIPDAVITQPSFKIVVETKMSDWFYSDQLLRHLESFKDENFKVLLTLAPELMNHDKKLEFDKQLAEYNSTLSRPIIHINTTFEMMLNAITDIIDDRDYEMIDVIEDYKDYCYKDHLIPISDSWKYMRMQLAGVTLQFNIENKVYYEKASRNFRAHDYLGLYSNKSVRAIGKVCARIIAVYTENGLEFEAEYGELTEERKATIRLAVLDGDKHGYDLRNIKHRYFLSKSFTKQISRKIPQEHQWEREYSILQKFFQQIHCLMYLKLQAYCKATHGVKHKLFLK